MSDPRDPIDALRAFGTPTIANALEALGLEPDDGITDARVSLRTEGLPPFIGRAVTGRMTTRRPVSGEPRGPSTEEWWRYVAAHPGPTIVVVEDSDPEPAGAMWGEVQGRLHQALGVVGIVTNGAVRDVGELTAIGLPAIAGRTCVSHTYARFLELDTPIDVAGLRVAPGDLLHADRHGVQRIPSWIDLDELLLTSTRIEELEGELFAAVGPALDDFLVTWRSVRSRWPAASGGAPAQADAI